MRRGARFAALTLAISSIAIVLFPAFAAADQPAPPSVTTGDATNKTNTSANLHATIKSTAPGITYGFDWGTSPGHYDGFATQTTTFGGDGQWHQVTIPLTGLQKGTTYYYRFRARNAIGASSGKEAHFQTTTLPMPHIQSVTPNTSTLDGGTTVEITGSGFTPSASVAFGFGTNTLSPGAPESGGRDVTYVSSTQLTATVPAVPGPMRIESNPSNPDIKGFVVVTTGGGQSSADFTYEPNACSPVCDFLNSLFSLQPGYSPSQTNFVSWLLQQPPVTGAEQGGASTWAATGLGSTPVDQIEALTSGIALGLLGLGFSVSILRFGVAGVGSANPGALVQGIVQPVGAAIVVMFWPHVFNLTGVLVDSITHTLALSQYGGATALTASIDALQGGVGNLGFAWIIAILFVIVGMLLFFALIALKLALYAGSALIFVGMPLAAVFRLFPPLAWVFPAFTRAWAVVVVLTPIGWAVVLDTAGALGVTARQLGGAGALVVQVGTAIVSIMLLFILVRWPGMATRVALQGTGAGNANRGLARSILTYAVGHAIVQKVLQGPAAAKTATEPPSPPGLQGRRATNDITEQAGVGVEPLEKPIAGMSREDVAVASLRDVGSQPPVRKGPIPAYRRDRNGRLGRPVADQAGPYSPTTISDPPRPLGAFARKELAASGWQYPSDYDSLTRAFEGLGHAQLSLESARRLGEATAKDLPSVVGDIADWYGQPVYNDLMTIAKAPEQTRKDAFGEYLSRRTAGKQFFEGMDPPATPAPVSPHQERWVREPFWAGSGQSVFSKTPVFTKRDPNDRGDE